MMSNPPVQTQENGNGVAQVTKDWIEQDPQAFDRVRLLMMSKCHLRPFNQIYHNTDIAAIDLTRLAIIDASSNKDSELNKSEADCVGLRIVEDELWVIKSIDSTRVKDGETHLRVQLAGTTCDESLFNQATFQGVALREIAWFYKRMPNGQVVVLWHPQWRREKDVCENLRNELQCCGTLL